MEIFLNELSVNDKIFDTYEKHTNFVELYRRLREEGISVCRASSEDLNLILSIINEDINKNLTNFIYSFIRAPYEKSDKINELEDEFYLHDWSCENQLCVGLPLAYLSESMTMSFADSIWGISISLKKDNETVNVRNVSYADHIQYHREWLESNKIVELVESDIDMSSKKIKLRDDHGKDILLDFANRIIKNKYIVSVVNSLPFNPNDKKFIRRVCTNGKIECVLHWTSKGYGLVLQTTGRNYQETKRISEILKEEFDE